MYSYPRLLGKMWCKSSTGPEDFRHLAHDLGNVCFSLGESFRKFNTKTFISHDPVYFLSIKTDFRLTWNT